MILFFLKRLISRNKEIILKESSYITGFMQLLMKPRNTGEGWTREEKDKLKIAVKHLSSYVPVLIIFLLPGGSLLLPFLAEILDRRKAPRVPESKI